MSLPFETVLADIVALTDVQLTHLLHRLLLLEAKKLGLPKRRASVSLSIDISDGGEDGRIEWKGGPDPDDSDWIPHRVTIFQVKATEMGPSKCGREVLTTTDAGASLKPRVANIVERAGAYVLCYSRPCEGSHVQERVDKIREAFAEVVGPGKAAAVTVDVYGAEKLATWTNEHAAAITFVMSCLRRSLPADLQTWASWHDTHQSVLSYHPDPARNAMLGELRAHFAEDGTVARLVGLSGLGKSRLALEAFRPPGAPADDPEQAALAAACIYVGDGAMSAEEVRRAMLSLRVAGVRAVLVIDECPLELHEKLEPIVTAPGSKLSLLTLDFEPSSHPRSSSCRFFRLEPVDTAHMTALLQMSSSAIPEQHLSKIAEFAQGFPRMAQLMVDATLNGQSNLWELASTAAIERLVIRRSHEPARILRVASALAVLEHLGVDGAVAYQLEVFAAELCGEDLHYTSSVLRELEGARIAYRRGDYIRLTPLPIAVALAGRWWNACMHQRAEALLLRGVLPPAMVDATANQLKRLSGNPWVEDLVTKIYGPDSPFRQRDQLDSARGSRLASSLAEVNPAAVCGALTQAFGALTPDGARSVSEGRRDLVWCLEKLVWWPSTFDDAAWILLLFAAGENEEWGNNATNEFCKLFHVYLSGTETPASARLGVLERGIRSAYPDVRRIAVRALGEALSAGHFHRMGGPDAQGGGLPRTDWKPHTWEEIRTYWASILDLLVPFLVAEDELGAEARTAVGVSVRGVIRWGGLSLVESVVERVRSHDRSWPEMLDGLRSALNYDGGEYKGDVGARVSELIRQLEPTDLETRLRITVSVPSWHELRRESSGKVVVVAEERAQRLAQEISKDPGSLLVHLPGLLQGEQRQAFKFGRELAMNTADALALLRTLVEAIRRIPAAVRNPLLAMGVAHLAAERNDAETREYIRTLANDDEVRLIAVDLVRAIGVTDDDADVIATQLAEKKLPSSCTHGFSFGGALDLLREETVADLVRACADADVPGPLFALEVLGMRTHLRPPTGALLPAARDLLLRPGLIARLTGAMGEHHFAKLAEAYISATQDAEFSGELTQRIVESISSDEGFPAGTMSRDLLTYLLREQLDATWPVLAQAFSADEGHLWLRLELTLEKLPLVELVGQDRLVAWCRENPDAPHWVARMIDPLRDDPGAGPFSRWSSFSLAMLEEYGSDPDVRSSISASIHSGAWSGSAVPRLTDHRDAFVELTRHANPDVVRWALDAVAGLDSDIARERKRDEERDFGIFR